jgi:hypothetical protein
MKIRILLPALLLFSLCSSSQELTHISYTGGAAFSSFAFTTDQQIIIKISDDGKVLEWGNQLEPGRYFNAPGKLQPYMGRVDYYGAEADSVSKGKVKSIGTCMLTYYGPFETVEKVGKLQSIGRISLDYYNNFENAAFKGKLKSAGYTQFSYYASFENEAFSGKLKMVANTPIVYYSTFDDKLLRGKVKSIGSFNYAWYSSFDRSGFQGGLKSGSMAQNVNGVTYLLW